MWVILGLFRNNPPQKSIPLKRGNGAPIIGKRCIKDQITLGSNNSRAILSESYLYGLKN